ncbi:MAG: FHA domain-containing protein [Planctomycetia bacterium]|nr:FHA domain-containing protein [Planctomycetia bacterium]
MYGKLIPMGGGDPIPLHGTRLVVGRRDECDITLRFPTVSGRHCELYCDDGYWFVKDLGSSNGVKVNGRRVEKTYIPPNAVISFAKYQYTLEYSPEENGAKGEAPMEDWNEAPIGTMFTQSLLERAGLSRKSVDKMHSRYDEDEKRFNPLDDRPGQIRRNDDPV